jgi:hypothetical protein
MPLWLSILIAIACILWALQQFRMFLIYRGRIYSPTVGAMEPNPTLSTVAIRSSLTCIVFAALVLLVPWPRLITYVFAALTARALLDTILSAFGRGIHAIPAVTLTPKGRRAVFFNSLAKVVGNAVLCAICIYFIGL